MIARLHVPRRAWWATTALTASVFALSILGAAVTGNVAYAGKNDDQDKGHNNGNNGNNGNGNNGGNNNKPSQDPEAKTKTESPIKHVIVLIGENRGLDHTFGTYRPKGKKQTIDNILSKQIVTLDGAPGPNIGLSQQFAVSAQPSYYIGAPAAAKFAYNGNTNLMPQPNTAGAPST